MSPIHGCRWEAALGNVEDARVAFDVIARAVDDAVYLDEDAYKQVLPTMQFTVRIQVREAVPFCMQEALY